MVDEEKITTKMRKFNAKKYMALWHLHGNIIAIYLESFKKISFISSICIKRIERETKSKKSSKTLLTFLFYAPYEQHFEIVCLFWSTSIKFNIFYAAEKNRSIQYKLPTSKFAHKWTWAKTKVKFYYGDVWLKQLKKRFQINVTSAGWCAVV